MCIGVVWYTEVDSGGFSWLSSSSTAVVTVFLCSGWFFGWLVGGWCVFHLGGGGSKYLELDSTNFYLHLFVLSFYFKFLLFVCLLMLFLAFER